MSLFIFLLVTCALPIALIRKSGYCANVALGWDLLLSSMTGGRSGETLSGRAGSAYLQHKFRGYVFVPVIDLLFHKGHCVGAVKGDELRAKAVLADYGRLPPTP